MSARPSKFEGLLERRSETVATPAIAEPDQSTGENSRSLTTAEAVPVSRLSASPTPKPSLPKRAEKAAAKRGHPDYFNLTVYIKKATRRAAAIKLAGMANAPEWSELVDELLSQWSKGTKAT